MAGDPFRTSVTNTNIKEGLVEFWHFFWAPPPPEFWEMPVEEEKNSVLPMPKPKQGKDIFVAFRMEDSDYTYRVHDTLPLDYHLNKPCPCGYLDFSNVINNTLSFCFFGFHGDTLQKHFFDFSNVEFGPLTNYTA